MSELRINNITDRAGSSGPIIAGVSTVTSTSHMVMPSGPTEFRGGRGRGVFMGAYNMPSPYRTANIDMIEIATTGNATDFGNLTAARQHHASVNNSIRCAWACGDTPTLVNTIDFVTIASTGNATDFGDDTITRSNGPSSASDAHGGLGE